MIRRMYVLGEEDGIMFLSVAMLQVAVLGVFAVATRKLRGTRQRR